MSEFPEWVERRIGLSHMTYEESLELHKKIAAVYELVPDIEELLKKKSPESSNSAPWWRR